MTSDSISTRPRISAPRISPAAPGLRAMASVAAAVHLGCAVGVAAPHPHQVAAAEGSATAEYLARVLRGEPLVPLSHVTFADEAGRPGPGGNGAAPLPEIVPSRKRVAAARSAGERPARA